MSMLSQHPITVSQKPGSTLPNAVNHLLVDIQDAFLAGEDTKLAS